MKLGIIDVGGGLRGIYGAGVLDRCMERRRAVRLLHRSVGRQCQHELLCGRSAWPRNKPFYQDYSFRKEYMRAWADLVHKHSYLDLDYVYGALSNAGGENSLDYPAVMASPVELVIVATDARTGKPVYFTKDDIHQNDYRPLMASCCIPVINRPIASTGCPITMAVWAGPAPLEKALAMGCDPCGGHPDQAHCTAHCTGADRRPGQKTGPAVTAPLPGGSTGLGEKQAKSESHVSKGLAGRGETGAVVS